MVRYCVVMIWIDNNFKLIQRQVNTPFQCTQFAYNLSRVKVGYYNTYIRASTTILIHIGDPGAKIPVSFQWLIDKLACDIYQGQLLPPSLQQRIPTIRGVW